MPDVDQHMDDLFRRAAESYPLRIPDNDWDQVRGAAPPPEPNGKSKPARRTVSIILLLLGLFLLIRLARKPDPALAGNSITPIPSLNERTPALKTTPPPSDMALNAFSRPDAGTNQILGTRFAAGEYYRFSEENAQTGQVLAERNLAARPVKKLALLPEPVVDAAIPYPSRTLAAGPPRHSDKTGFYIGAQAGVEWNTVKNQGFKSGYNAGVLIGYRFSPHWALEAGITISKKRYYSDGKYFDMAQMPGSMPPGMTIISLNGNSTVIEFPVMVNFYPARGAGRWGKPVFSAGINSYLQTKELNRYQVSLNGSEQQMTGKYKSDHRYGAATLQLSAGIEKPLNLKKAIRLSPYIQIPLKGIGIGSMQVWSAGIRLGLISRLP